MKKLQVLLLMLFGLTFVTSCGSDVDCSDDAAIEAELDPFVDTFLSAATNYAANPTDENCNAIKDAIDSLIDKTKEFEDCVDPSEMDEYQESLDELEASKDALPC